MSPKKDILDRLDALCDLEDDELNVWEAKFVNDCAKQLRGPEPRVLSSRQIIKINELWEREVGK